MHAIMHNGLGAGWLAGCSCIWEMKWNRTALESELNANQNCVSLYPQERLAWCTPQGRKYVVMREELCLSSAPGPYRKEVNFNLSEGNRPRLQKKKKKWNICKDISANQSPFIHIYCIGRTKNIRYLVLLEVFNCEQHFSAFWEHPHSGQHLSVGSTIGLYWTDRNYRLKSKDISFHLNKIHYQTVNRVIHQSLADNLSF